MNLPRFTGEASLRPTVGGYQAGFGGNATSGSGSVIPAKSGCTPCFGGIINPSTGVIGGTQQCCVEIPILQPNGSILTQEVCWWRSCGAVGGGVVLV